MEKKFGNGIIPTAQRGGRVEDRGNCLFPESNAFLCVAYNEGVKN